MLFQIVIKQTLGYYEINDGFQNYVILDSNKTEIKTAIEHIMFQNYVILDSNKT